MRGSRKAVLLGSLYFSQGLPFGFFTQALPVLMRAEGYSLAEVGLATLAALPWAFKFVWAPLVDRYGSARWGRRRSWILPLQAATLGTLSLAALLPFRPSLELWTLVVLVNLLSATQDIAADGLAVDTLDPEERGWANGLQVAAYRLGMITGGGVLLAMSDVLTWSGLALTMAALIALGTWPVARLREKPRVAGDGTDPAPPRITAGHLAFLALYKVGDAAATTMLRPYLVDRGLSASEVGQVLGMIGFTAGLAGALLGGALVNVVGRRRALVAFGALQAATLLAYAGAAQANAPLSTWTALAALEHLAGGMATAALFTVMMDLAPGPHSASRYTLQASAVVIATGLAGAASGFSAQALGYAAHFGACALSGFAAAALALSRGSAPPAPDFRRKEAASCA